MLPDPGPVAGVVPGPAVGAAAVNVMATAVPTSPGEKGGVAVPLFCGGAPAGGRDGIGKTQARMAAEIARNAIRNRKELFMVTSLWLKQETLRIFAQCLPNCR